MSDHATDFYHHKTDAELLFFVEHPDHYQPVLVAEARRELRRRGVALPVPVAPEAPAAPLIATGPAQTGLRTGPIALATVAVLAVSLGVLYFIKQKERPAAAEVVAAPVKKAPPKLTEVATSAIPSYDGAVAGAVVRQLQQVPAKEKADAQHLRQFRELAKRFWTAETQTEYLVNQVYAGKNGPMFVDQTVTVRETWRDWNHAAVYSFKFGPVMQAQFERMAEAASNQQHILDNLPDLLAGREFLKDEEMQNRTTDVEDLVGGLLPVSPVSGRAYKRVVLKAKPLKVDLR
ncbi:hypothetical protein [Hymenobacter rubidus]|uniref:hypothetical protein n=1 Tax=Hymenobacter rubidus TaxID=1441626 RepID=UPI00191E94C8|nr:hypothetical protein [Hymenobacter rubidus]